MAITVFRISKLPERVTLLKDAIAVVLNQSYPIAEQNEISHNNASGFKGEFLDKMEIEVSEDETEWSSPAIVNIKELVSINTPESANDSIVGLKNTSYNLYDLSKFPINNSTDRIKITDIQGFGNWTFNSFPLNIGDEILMHELPNIVGQTLNGAGIPYMSISYYCGNHLGYNELTEYLLEINITSLAEINSQNVSGSNPVFDEVIVENGLSNKIAAIEAIITGDMFANGPASEIIINYNGNILTVNANGTYNFNLNLDNEGIGSLEVQHNYSNFGTPATSNVQLTIEDVDGDPANVSVTNTYTSTVNYT